MAAESKCKVCAAEGLSNRRKVRARGMCATHLRACRSDRRQALREKHVADTYGITEQQYQAIYEAQGRVCAGCLRATGTGKYRLSVDHDHNLAREHAHPESKGCPECIRGLLCRSCNARVLGHLRDDIELLIGVIEYLLHPPARQVLGCSVPANLTPTAKERLRKIIKNH